MSNCQVDSDPDPLNAQYPDQHLTAWHEIRAASKVGNDLVLIILKNNFRTSFKEPSVTRCLMFISCTFTMISFDVASGDT